MVIALCKYYVPFAFKCLEKGGLLLTLSLLMQYHRDKRGSNQKNNSNGLLSLQRILVVLIAC